MNSQVHTKEQNIYWYIDFVHAILTSYEKKAQMLGNSIKRCITNFTMNSMKHHPKVASTFYYHDNRSPIIITTQLEKKN